MPKGEIKRTRNYATVVYPESCPSNWLDILNDFHVQCFVSPLHDSDLTNGGTENKKPHYHVMVMYDNVKTEKQAKELFDFIGGVGCLALSSIRSYARYLCHLDDPNKYQYNVADVRSFGGADYLTIIGTMADRNSCIKEMIKYINDADLTSFSKLVEYAMENKETWFDCLTNHGSYFIKEYIKSRAWTNEARMVE